jgi:hypothetical protein
MADDYQVRILPRTPAPTAAPAEGVDEETGLVWKVLDVLGRPGRATAGAVLASQQGRSVGEAVEANLRGTRQDTFDDVLAQAGVEDGTGRRVAGFAADVVLDPTNLLPVGAIGKAAKAGAEVLGIAKPLAKAGAALKETPLVESLGQRFIPYYGLDKFTAKAGLRTGEKPLTYQDLRRLHQSYLTAVRDDAGQKTLDLLQGLTKDESYQVAKALDTGQTLVDPKLEAVRLRAKGAFQEQFAKEAGAGLLDPSTRIEDYVTHQLIRDPAQRAIQARKLTAKNPYQLRKDLSLEEGVQAGVFESDLRKIMATRLSVGDRAIANQEFFNQIAEQFGTRVQHPGEIPAGWRVASFSADAPLKHSLEGVALPNQIADDVAKLVQIQEQPDTVSQLLRGATALWKGYATRANPGFHLRNGVSNMVQTWIGGLGDAGGGILNPARLIKTHAKAASLLRDPGKIGQVGAYSGDEIRTALRHYGVVSEHSSSFDELNDLIENEVKHAGESSLKRTLTQTANPLNTQNALLKKGAAAGNQIENTSRLALFLDQLEKGRSLEDAALHVRKYLFDYSELTDTERAIRDTTLPFYTWMRKNIPLQLETLVKDPAKLATIDKARTAVEDATEDAGVQLPMGSIPEWMRDQVQLPFLDDQGAAVFGNPSLPVQDLNKLDPAKFRENFLAGLNPLVRIPIEVGANKEMFTGRPIYNEDLGPMSLRRANPLAAHLGLGTVETQKGTEMPAILDYAMRQNPMTTTMGRVATLAAEETPSTLDVASFAGLPVRRLTEEQQRTQRTMTRNEQKRQRRAEREEQRRRKTPTKGEISSLYQTYLASGQ